MNKKKNLPGTVVKKKKNKWQLKKEKQESKYSQFDPKIHKMSKSGIGFGMKDNMKESRVELLI